MRKLKAIVKRPGKDPEVVEIDDDYKAISGIVGGMIELIRPMPRDPKVHLYCHEEGKLLGLEPNFLMPARGDIIVGTVVFLRDGRNGAEASLTKSNLKEIVESFGTLAGAERVGGSVFQPKGT